MKKSELIQDFFLKFFYGVNSSGIKITLIEVIKNDLLIKEVTKGMVFHRIEWWKLMHMNEPDKFVRSQSFRTKALLLLLLLL